MRIIEPLDIGPSELLYGDFLVRPNADPLLVEQAKRLQVSVAATNVPENDHPEWAAGTAYAVGARVIRGGHRWECLVAHSGVDPLTDASTPPKWLDLGFTNRWRAFDDKIGTYTEHPERIDFSLSLGSSVDGIGFFGVDAASVVVKVIDPYRGVVFERTEVTVSTDRVDNWHAYFFNEVEARQDFVMLDIPRTPFGAVEVSVKKPAGIARIGSLVVGRVAELGIAIYGTSIGIVDYSRKDRDAFGNSIVLQRDFSKRAEFDVQIETRRVSFVQRTLAKWRARPLVWIGEAMMEETLLLGYYRDFDITISGPTMSDGTITVEGLN